MKLNIILDLLKKAILPISIVTNVSLIIQINNLPDNISERLYGKLNTDSVVKTKAVNLPALQQKGAFTWFEGTVISDSKNLKSQFGYDIDYPVEFYDGYYSLAESVKGSKYLLWSKNKISVNGAFVEGWFWNPGAGKFQVGNEYHELIIPFSEKTELKFNQ